MRARKACFAFFARLPMSSGAFGPINMDSVSVGHLPLTGSALSSASFSCLAAPALSPSKAIRAASTPCMKSLVKTDHAMKAVPRVAMQYSRISRCASATTSTHQPSTMMSWVRRSSLARHRGREFSALQILGIQGSSDVGFIVTTDHGRQRQLCRLSPDRKIIRS